MNPEGARLQEPFVGNEYAERLREMVGMKKESGQYGHPSENGHGENPEYPDALAALETMPRPYEQDGEHSQKADRRRG